ncbi:MAG: hypothetical protein PVI40_03175 [Chlamydiota bacterium]|jgi:hypothetical protein
MSKSNNSYSKYLWILIPIISFGFNFVKNKFQESENVSKDLIPISELTTNEITKGSDKEWDKIWKTLDKEDEGYIELQDKIYPYFDFMKGKEKFYTPSDTPLWLLAEKIDQLINIHEKNYNLWEPLLKNENKWIRAYAIANTKSCEMSLKNAKILLLISQGEDVKQDISSFNRNQHNIQKLNDYQIQLDQKFEQCFSKLEKMIDV